MIDLLELLTPTQISCQSKAHSRKRALQTLAELIADDDLGADEIFDGLMARERLGSTGLGDGIAIPHCRMSCNKMRVAFITLAEPIDYEASDGLYVDLLFALLVPEDETTAHLEALAVLSSLFVNSDTRDKLRAVQDDQVLFDELRAQISITQTQLNQP